ncbi:MAG: SUF system NifU family Fe-S cluster assembly protein [Pseudomonadota bacterium]|nr:SUF system NifU family Fe-S cluster assembly protein [Pseudomonadota bacterium]
MSMAREIYQQIIVDHGRNPRNYGELSAPVCCAEGHNRLCGDSVKVYMRSDKIEINACKFTGEGCAIAIASASLMTEVVHGMHIKDVKALFDDFHGAIVNGENFKYLSPQHERISVFLGVADYPARVKCATLAWQTLLSIINNTNTNRIISTE